MKKDRRKDRAEMQAVRGIVLPEMGGSLMEVARFGAGVVLKAAIAAEIEQYLGRDYYERIGGKSPSSAYRNGYRATNIETASGTISYERPILAGAPDFRSLFHTPYMRKPKEFTEAVADMYVNGVSTRKVKKALRASAGANVKLSKSTVSRITEGLRNEFNAWQKRDLSELKPVYLFLDGIRIGMRLDASKKQAVLVAYAVLTDGSFELVSLGLGHSESNATWDTFLADLKKRGMADPLLTISDGNQGVITAIDKHFPLSWRQRCVRHKIENVLDAIPKEDHDTVRADLNRIFYGATSLEQAKEALVEFRKKYRKTFPTALARLENDLDQALTFFMFPSSHWKRLRTSNSLERMNLEIRRRMNVIGRHPDETGCLSLVFAVCKEHAARNRAFKANDIVQALWRRLRHERQEMLNQLREAVVEKKAA